MNTSDLINIKYKNFNIFLILIFILIIFVFIIFWQDTCEVYTTYGYVSDNKLYLNIPISNPDTLSKMEYLVIDGKKDNGVVKNISEILLEEETFINYQKVVIKLKKSYLENQVLTTKIYYNKEKVYEKLKKLFF